MIDYRSNYRVAVCRFFLLGSKSIFARGLANVLCVTHNAFVGGECIEA